jgi:hypothetical protein
MENPLRVLIVDLDKFKMLSPSLSEVLGALRFDRLRDASANLDFQQGAQLLREARLMGPPIPMPARRGSARA